MFPALDVQCGNRHFAPGASVSTDYRQTTNLLVSYAVDSLGVFQAEMAASSSRRQHFRRGGTFAYPVFARARLRS